MSDDASVSPRANPDLVGHGAAEAQLLAAWNSGRMHHAWLLAGPRGIGKATLAYRFARFLLAHGDPGRGGAEAGLFGDAPAAAGLEIPPSHPVFRRVAAGAHGDVMTVERGIDEKRGRRRAEIVVEDVRGLSSFLAMTAAEGGWRVVVIDAADEMNRNAANAVLKVLEEPPARAMLLLVSHNPGRLLATIRSRCRVLALRPLAEDDIVAILRRHHGDIDPADAAALAALAEGSVGRALSLADGEGLALYREMLALLEGEAGRDPARLHSFADKVARAGAEASFETLSELMRWWLGRLVADLARSGGVSADGTAGGGGSDAAAARLAPLRGLDRWLEVWEKTDHLLARARSGNLDRKQVVLNAFLAIDPALGV